MGGGEIVGKSNALGRKILLVRVAGGGAIVLFGFQQQALLAGLYSPHGMNAYSILHPYLEEAIKRKAFDTTQWGKWRSCCGGGFDCGQGRLYG